MRLGKANMSKTIIQRGAWGLIFATLLLTGCHHKMRGVITEDPFRAKVYILDKVARTTTSQERLTAKRSQLENRLAHHSVNLIQVGDEFKLLLPADHFFIDLSPKIKEEAYYDLDHISAYLNTYDKVGVEVASYTDNVCSKERNLALSRARAENIVKYLLRQGLDARVVMAVGYSRCEPISTNLTREGKKQNQRVEISWRLAVD